VGSGVVDPHSDGDWASDGLEGTPEINRHHRALMWVAEQYKRQLYKAQTKEPPPE
jgi:hypothetical protein